MREKKSKSLRLVSGTGTRNTLTLLTLAAAGGCKAHDVLKQVPGRENERFIPCPHLSSCASLCCCPWRERPAPHLQALSATLILFYSSFPISYCCSRPASDLMIMTQTRVRPRTFVPCPVRLCDHRPSFRHLQQQQLDLLSSINSFPSATAAAVAAAVAKGPFLVHDHVFFFFSPSFFLSSFLTLSPNMSQRTEFCLCSCSPSTLSD